MSKESDFLITEYSGKEFIEDSGFVENDFSITETANEHKEEKENNVSEESKLITDIASNKDVEFLNSLSATEQGNVNSLSFKEEVLDLSIRKTPIEINTVSRNYELAKSVIDEFFGIKDCIDNKDNTENNDFKLNLESAVVGTTDSIEAGTKKSVGRPKTDPRLLRRSALARRRAREDPEYRRRERERDRLRRREKRKNEEYRKMERERERARRKKIRESRSLLGQCLSFASHFLLDTGDAAYVCLPMDD